jgi:hypothetical protein
VEPADFFQDAPIADGPEARRSASGGIWAAGDRLIWIGALILALSTFMDWYAGSGVGVKLAVIGWHTGILGKLVFFIGLAVLAIVALREAGIELPPSTPESLVILALGALATVFVLIRVISIPDSVLPADGRGIGIWISLVAALAVIAGGLLRAAEEL